MHGKSPVRTIAKCARRRRWTSCYAPPPLDAVSDEALQACMAQRKRELVRDAR
ncbi:MAG: hypothetical protein WAU00_17045 [Caldilinea sp.]|nr:hypothetical protein [Anaerolineales bacterium]HRA69031.1 hypothetical protein [Caldilinea sp.]